MSKKIELYDNNVYISEDCLKELTDYHNINKCWFWEDQIVTVYNCLYFRETIEDYFFYYPELLEILKKHCCKGDIVFSSLEQFPGKYWGYRFDGNGGCKKLIGGFKIVLEES